MGAGGRAGEPRRWAGRCTVCQPTTPTTDSRGQHGIAATFIDRLRTGTPVSYRGPTTYVLYRLRASFWFVPGAMAVVAFIAAALSLWADGAGVSELLKPLGAPFSIEKDTARDLLSTLAGATVTVVSLVFSLTLVTLTVAAGNLGARLLERYMQNRVTQVTMGLFVGTFVYTVVVLSAVGIGPIEVPRLSVVTALVMSIFSVGWLMYAFHDLARSLQVDQAAAEIGATLRRDISVAAARAREIGVAGSDDLPTGGPQCVVEARATGYVESIDWLILGAVAREHGLVLDVPIAQGAYVTPVDPIATVYGRAEADDALCTQIREAVILGSVRTEADDLMFLLHLLVEIASRALSPGINDLYTALACVDHVTGSLAQAIKEGLERISVRDDAGRLLVRTRSADVSRMASTALSTLRRNGMHNPTFALRLIRNIERLAPLARSHPTGPVFLEHLDRIAEHAAANVLQVDREAIEAAADRAREAFGV